MQAFNESNELVEEGDTVTDFRGEKWFFVTATRENEQGRDGKIIVRRANDNLEREFYARVCGLKVQ